MVKLIFEFDGDRLKDKNLTEDEMLAEVREFAGEMILTKLHTAYLKKTVKMPCVCL